MTECNPIFDFVIVDSRNRTVDIAISCIKEVVRAVFPAALGEIYSSFVMFYEIKTHITIRHSKYVKLPCIVRATEIAKHLDFIELIILLTNDIFKQHCHYNLISLYI